MNYGPHKTSAIRIPLGLFLAAKYTLRMDPTMPIADGIPTGPAHSVNSFSIKQVVKSIGTIFLPYWLVSCYRRIPPEIRGQAFPGPSTSHQALEDMRHGVNGWTAIRRHAHLTWR
jgi:hypothetical protein